MPVLTHPTEWPDAARRGLTHKIGPLPVWGYGAIAIGILVILRIGRKNGSTSTPVNTLLPIGGGAFAGGSGGGGGDSGLPSISTPLPGSAYSTQPGNTAPLPSASSNGTGISTPLPGSAYSTQPGNTAPLPSASSNGTGGSSAGAWTSEGLPLLKNWDWQSLIGSTREQRQAYVKFSTRPLYDNPNMSREDLIRYYFAKPGSPDWRPITDLVKGSAMSNPDIVKQLEEERARKRIEALTDYGQPGGARLATGL